MQKRLTCAGDLPHEGASFESAFFGAKLMAGLRTGRLFRFRRGLLASASQFLKKPVRQVRRSFLLTAAGQFWIHTRFPIHAPISGATNSSCERSTTSLRKRSRLHFFGKEQVFAPLVFASS